MERIPGINQWIEDLTNYQVKRLLRPIFRNGQLVYQLPTIHNIRNRSIAQIQQFDKKTLNEYKQGLEYNLHNRKMKMIEAVGNEQSAVFS